MRKICQEAFKLVSDLNDELGPHLPMSFTVASDGYGATIGLDGFTLFDSENDSLYDDNDDEITLRDFVLRALGRQHCQIGAVLDKLQGAKSYVAPLFAKQALEHHFFLDPVRITSGGDGLIVQVTTSPQDKVMRRVAAEDLDLDMVVKLTSQISALLNGCTLVRGWEKDM